MNFADEFMPSAKTVCPWQTVRTERNGTELKTERNGNRDLFLMPTVNGLSRLKRGLLAETYKGANAEEM